MRAMFGVFRGHRLHIGHLMMPCVMGMMLHMACRLRAFNGLRAFNKLSAINGLRAVTAVPRMKQAHQLWRQASRAKLNELAAGQRRRHKPRRHQRLQQKNRGTQPNNKAFTPLN